MNASKPAPWAENDRIIGLGRELDAALERIALLEHECDSGTCPAAQHERMATVEMQKQRDESRKACEDMLPAETQRQLERERDEARARIAELEKQVEGTRTIAEMWKHGNEATQMRLEETTAWIAKLEQRYLPAGGPVAAASDHDAGCPADRRSPRWTENCTCRSVQLTNASERDREAAWIGTGEPFEPKQPKIADRCPSCGAQSLFIGSSGWLTCSVIGCKEPGVSFAQRAALAAARLEGVKAGIEAAAKAECHRCARGEPVVMLVEDLGRGRVQLGHAATDKDIASNCYANLVHALDAEKIARGE